MQHKVSRKYLLFIFLFYTLLFNEPLTKAISIFGYEDELLAVFAIPLWVLSLVKKKRSEVKTGATPFVIGFLLCCLAGSVFYKYQPFLQVAMPDLLLCTKFWLCIYSGAILFKNLDIVKYAKNIYFHVKLIIWVYFLLSILNMGTGIFGYFDYRFGFGSNALFYSHPTVLVGSCSFLIVIILALMPYVKRSFFYIALASIAMCTTLRSKAIADALIFVLVYYFITVRKQKFTIKSMLPFVPVVFFIGWSQVEYYFVSLGEGSARAQLLVKSFQIAKDHFPVGAGFGTYGSYYSAVYYSPLYYKYGLNTIYGLSKELYSFICDSFWPMILGQAGFVGTVLYAIAVIKLFQRLTQIKKNNLFFYVSAIGAMSYLLVESVAATAFVHPLSMPLAMWIGILISNANRIEPNKEKMAERISLAQERRL